MEVDTGAAASLISEAMYKGSLARSVKPPLKCADVSLHTYSGEVLPVVGQISVTVKFQDQKQQLPLLVVRGVGPSLLGHDWFRELKIDLTKLSVFHIQAASKLSCPSIPNCSVMSWALSRVLKSSYTWTAHTSRVSLNHDQYLLPCVNESKQNWIDSTKQVSLSRYNSQIGWLLYSPGGKG